MQNNSDFIGIILAGGTSSRTQIDKLWQEVHPDFPVILYSLLLFEQSELITWYAVVIPKKFKTKLSNVIKKYSLSKCKMRVEAGASRYASVYNALQSIRKTISCNDKIVVHNGANPFLKLEDFHKGLRLAQTKSNVVFAYPAVNTIKKVTKQSLISEHVSRVNLYEAQTPQIFPFETLYNAYKKGLKHSTEYTDDSEVVSAYTDKPIYVHPCSKDNVKITYTSDLYRTYVIGYGEDTHMFEKAYKPSKPLVLGGLHLKNKLSIKATSDGDIICHSLYNAFASGLGLRPIGAYGTTQAKKGNLNSASYLNTILKKVKQKKYSIDTVIIHIEARKPQFSPFHKQLQNSISHILSLDQSHIGIVYETGDNVSLVSKSNGIRVKSFVLLSKLN